MPLLGNYTGTQFGANVLTAPADNEAIGADLLEREVRDGMKLVISDGSSTAFVARSLFNSPRQNITICTPSIAIANEFALASTHNPMLAGWHLQLLEGAFNRELFAVFGRRAEDFMAEEAASSDLAIISVKAFVGIEGPVGKEPSSLALKRKTAEKANKIVWIADWKKLAHPTATGPKVYHSLSLWQTEAANERTHVVVSSPPGFDPIADAGSVLPAVAKSDIDLFRVNLRKLKDLLQSRLRVVKP